MAESPLLIYIRRAIKRLGEDAPASLDDVTQIADLATDFHVQALDEVLADADWPFANTYAVAEAADDGDTPLIKWANKYKFPADPYCVVLREVYQGVTPLKPDTQFEISGRFILTDGGTITYRFTRREDDPNKWPIGFAAAYEAKLRQVLAFPVTNDVTIEEKAEGAYLRALGRATGQVYTEGGRSETRYDGISEVVD